MSAAVTTAGRATRRQICSRHGVEYGQTYDPGISGVRESIWIGACRGCEMDLRDKLLAAEDVARQTEEIAAEAERRKAADPERTQRIRELADRDLMEEAAKMLAEFCATHRGEWESFHDDLDHNRIVAEIEDERRQKSLERLQAAERG
jgi:hypothetical protein